MAAVRLVKVSDFVSLFKKIVALVGAALGFFIKLGMLNLPQLGK